MSEFSKLLREYDQALSRSALRPAAEARTRQVLIRHVERTGSRRFRVRSGEVLVGALTLAAAVGVGVWVSQRAPSAAVPESAQVGSAECTVETLGADEREYTGRCNLRLPYVNVSSEPQTVLREQRGVARVVMGRAAFRVDPVPPGVEPVRVGVVGGEIQVIGTEFEVTQGVESGRVDLRSGVIRFVANTGTERTLHPGEHVAWAAGSTEARVATQPSLAAASSSAASPSAASPSVGAAADPGVPTTAQQRPPLRDAKSAATPAAEPGIGDVGQLRAQGKYTEALRLVERLERSASDTRTHEVLSYEKGALLEYLGRASAACHQWQRHHQRFTSGRYQAQVSFKLERCADGDR